MTSRDRDPERRGDGLRDLVGALPLVALLVTAVLWMVLVILVLAVVGLVLQTVLRPAIGPALDAVLGIGLIIAWVGFTVALTMWSWPKIQGAAAKARIATEERGRAERHRD